jgi:hypothetical protein
MEGGLGDIGVAQAAHAAQPGARTGQLLSKCLRELAERDVVLGFVGSAGRLTREAMDVFIRIKERVTALMQSVAHATSALSIRNWIKVQQRGFEPVFLDLRKRSRSHSTRGQTASWHQWNSAQK